MSGFKKLFESQDDNPPTIEPVASQPALSPTPTPTPTAEAPAPAKRGRAKGKRSDPNYTQVGAYIPKDLDREVKRKLLDTDQDFSELIADLLIKWLSD